MRMNLVSTKTWDLQSKKFTACFTKIINFGELWQLITQDAHIFFLVQLPVFA